MTLRKPTSAVLFAAALCWTGCGDDAPAGETGGSTSAQGSTGETMDPTSDSGTSSTSDTPADASTGSADTTGSQDPGTSSGSGDTADTDLPPGNCVEEPTAECPPAPGAIPTELAEGWLDMGAATALDVRGIGAFTTAHLPGATVLDAGDLRASVDGVSGQVAPPAEAQVVFEAAGIAPDDALIVYGDDNGTDPSRVVWTLLYYGHTGPVWTLDGGLDQWTSEGRDIETMGEPAGGSSYAPAIDDALRVDAQWVLDHLDDPAVTLVDARTDGEYGSGHIPGALSVNWTRNLGADGLFLPADELRALYGDPDEGQTLVTYCQTGSRASVDWLVLAMLGYGDVRLYDGSWSEWSADPTNPVE